MRTQEQDTGAGTRTVSGSVAATGALTTGGGFYVIKGAAGQYYVHVLGARAVISAVVTSNTIATPITTSITQPDTISCIASADVPFNLQAKVR